MANNNLSSWGFSVRTANCLLLEGILTYEDLLQKSPRELLRVPNLGRKPLLEIETAVAARGGKLKEDPA